MGTRQICICFDCKRAQAILPEHILLWQGQHWGHSVTIGTEDENEVWIFKEMASEEAEG